MEAKHIPQPHPTRAPPAYQDVLNVRKVSMITNIDIYNISESTVVLDGTEKKWPPIHFN